MRKFHIPQPCHENWNKMLPAEGGRHCKSCSKNVHDFTGMNDEEIIQKINLIGENPCARFTNKQLGKPDETTIKISHKNKARKLIEQSVLTFAGLTLTHHVIAQQTETVPQNVNTQDTNKRIVDIKATVVQDGIPLRGDSALVISTAGAVIGLSKSIDGRYKLQLTLDTAKNTPVNIAVISNEKPVFNWDTVIGIGTRVIDMDITRIEVTGGPSISFFRWDPKITWAEGPGLTVTLDSGFTVTALPEFEFHVTPTPPDPWLGNSRAILEQYFQDSFFVDSVYRERLRKLKVQRKQEPAPQRNEPEEEFPIFLASEIMTFRKSIKDPIRKLRNV